jgi:hypothetical protein
MDLQVGELEGPVIDQDQDQIALFAHSISRDYCSMIIQ